MQDNVCPYLGDCSNAGWFEPPREECAQRWGRHNGCSATGSGSDWQEEQLTELSFKYSWPAACGSGSQGETVFYKIEDFGHVPAPNCNQIKYIQQLVIRQYSFIIALCHPNLSICAVITSNQLIGCI
jgi:hypothetical protein